MSPDETFTCEVEGLSPDSQDLSGHGVALNGQAAGLIQGLCILAQCKQCLTLQQQCCLHSWTVQPDCLVSMPLCLPAFHSRNTLALTTSSGCKHADNLCSTAASDIHVNTQESRRNDI